MANQNFTRKLTAILTADVKGYSRLMGEDEMETVRTITTYREAMCTLIQDHRGRVVDSPGDNVLSEFASIIDALQCAVEIQKDFKAKNAELPEERRMEFRIGINLGDVIQDGERIYGDGVNIAARVESLAKGGGICITRTVFDHVRKKLQFGYEYIGEHTVKNIAEPLGVYRVLLEPEDAGKVIGENKAQPKQRSKTILATVVFVIVGTIAVAIWNMYLRSPPTEVASVEKKVVTLPDRPSIAVLPFNNMSGNPDYEYFSDGITEDIITDLSKIKNLLVIARNSTFVYKGKSIDIKEVGKKLGVRYVLEGSVRRIDNQVRINAQLIDTNTGYHLWAERYDGEMHNIFGLQDQINRKIFTELKIKLTADQTKSLTKVDTDSVEAYDNFLKGWAYYQLETPEGYTKAAHLFRKAIELDPNYSRAYGALAMILYNGPPRFGPDWHVSVGFKNAIDSSLTGKLNLETAMKNPNSSALSLSSYINAKNFLFEEALIDAQKAIELEPNSVDANLTMGKALIHAGKPNKAIEYLENYQKLNPNHPAEYFYYLALAQFSLDHMEESNELVKRAIRYAPDNSLYYGLAQAVSAILGHTEDVKVRWKKIKKDGRARGYLGHIAVAQFFFLHFNNLEVVKRFAGGLLKAGVPGKMSDLKIISKISTIL
ncbi:adenylate/guanylate cyclase domain-containing protein [Desulfobacula sp.]|uniref:adenylate/guanylate cyclase domain-containing protein n=1 Tax=Desulfobacula sp. TaxID=2593537 RepID=UPI001DB61F88|nr:hypothetical protein [Desulfobacula sp.]